MNLILGRVTVNKEMRTLVVGARNGHMRELVIFIVNPLITDKKTRNGLDLDDNKIAHLYCG